MKVKSESEVTQSCPTLATPWTAAYQAPLSVGFSRQKYWSSNEFKSVPVKTKDQHALTYGKAETSRTLNSRSLVTTGN